MTDIWSYPESVWTEGDDVIGYDVHATDGSIGKIDESTLDAGRQYVVVDTGFWIFGKKRVVPGRAVRQIDLDGRKVFVDMTKDEVEAAPDHHDEWAQPERREPFSGYYGDMPW